MYKGSHSFKAPVIVALTVCYLTLLGYHHFTRPVQDQDVLVSGDFAREIPKELTRSKPVRQILEKTRAPLPGPESKFTFHPGSRPQLAQKHLGPKARYEYYQELATELGYQLDGLTVLGFRGISPDGKRHPSGNNSSPYDDTFVILNPSTGTVTTLLGSTHAGQPTSTLSPGGVAQIKPGSYRAVPAGEYAQMDCWLVTRPSGEEQVPCWRDANGNGFVDSQEKRSGLTATEILFHNGRYPDYGSSIGCQVLPPELMERFIREVGSENSFDFILIDANRRFS
ncbi:MAG TPA: hypothetical protein EYO33_20700 [Phycisphaerales bacterium]|nr:hypothetical protein [Phycisphaerales bacterium]